MTAAIIATEKLDVRYRGFTTVSEADLMIAPNTNHSVIGPNGAVKTMLLHALTGRNRPSLGCVWFGGGNITPLADDRRMRRGPARSFQVTRALLHK